MFQALQAAFRRFCSSPIVSPTSMNPAPISEIISDNFLLVMVLGFFVESFLSFNPLRAEEFHGGLSLFVSILWWAFSTRLLTLGYLALGILSSMDSTLT